MGPRKFFRGKCWSRSCSRPRSFSLQWGRGNSSAERSARVLTERDQAALQWGRGNSSAERDPLRFGRRVAQRASMGPRKFFRGKASTIRRCCKATVGFNGAAEILPRKDRLAAIYARYKEELQWGRGNSSAE